MKKREEIRIRDPFILTDRENNCYYMYGTTALKEGSLSAKNKFSVYKTYDLENFDDGKVIFDGDKSDFWGEFDYWAPEVHEYKGKYYLFGSCKAHGKSRATQIFVSDTPNGNFEPLAPTARTPEGWECLDGTFFVENDLPYMVFSHEWTEVKNGEIWAMELSEDLTHPTSEPFLLFRASDNPNVTDFKSKTRGDGNYVTDGPFLYTENGKLKMIWSSFYENRYLVLEAEADSLKGEWTHFGSRFDFDGGHAMLFFDLEGKRKISLHKPNTANFERAAFFEF